ncbi:MAG: zinc ABC transporter substrate-binding protein [Pseudomonadota bacterium]
MKTLLNILSAALLLACALPAQAALNVFACEPEWAALVQELAGDKASVYAATNALQDPHRVDARPSLIAKARRAQLVVCTGAELETAWLPVILREAGNPDVAPGKPGYFEAASQVAMREVPSRLDRAEGDIHPFGNPHIQLDARNFLPIAQALTQRLAALDPANAATYRARLDTFSQKWREALLRWEKQAAPLKGVAIVVQHKAFPYLEAWLGMKEVAALEPKPGMEPSAAYLSQLVGQLQQHPAKMILRAGYQSPKSSDWLAERTQLKIVTLSFSVGGSDAAKDLFGLFDDTLARLLAGLK